MHAVSIAHGGSTACCGHRAANFTACCFLLYAFPCTTCACAAHPTPLLHACLHRVLWMRLPSLCSPHATSMDHMLPPPACRPGRLRRVLRAYAASSIRDSTPASSTIHATPSTSAAYVSSCVAFSWVASFLGGLYAFPYAADSLRQTSAAPRRHLIARSRHVLASSRRPPHLSFAVSTGATSTSTPARPRSLSRLLKTVAAVFILLLSPSLRRAQGRSSGRPALGQA